MEGGAVMNTKKYFSKDESFVVEAMLLLYRANKVAIVDMEDGELRPYTFRDYVDEKADVLAGVYRSTMEAKE